MRFVREVLLITAAISIALLFLDIVLLLAMLCFILVVPVASVHAIYTIIKLMLPSKVEDDNKHCKQEHR